MTDETQLGGDGLHPTYEEVYVAPFPAPSKKLLDMLDWLHESQLAVLRCMEFNTQELYALGELTPLQIDSLLMRGTIA